ncbi:response regulator [Cohnella yongneupensis]|uniref:Response regulator n=1 Tax=Cohnella yongneupensis TaxID=425006 RepID=A0ABW0R234_9BACL
MFQVLIVDDEPIARESLRYLIDWEDYGFSVKAGAEDGEQALAMLREGFYSLVLTDIRMPKMNGLELIERMREITDASVIILSGYDDFEYARQGIKLGVKDYLLKPVDEEDLIAVLLRVHRELTDRELLHRRQQAGDSAFRERVLRRLAHGQLNRGEYAEQLRLAEFPAEREAFRCLSIEMDSTCDAALSDRDFELKRYAIRNILDELCLATGGFVFEESEDRYGIIYAGDARVLGDADSVRVRAETIAGAVRLYAKETVTIGIGGAESALERIADSYRAAEAAADGKFLAGTGAILAAPPSRTEDDTARTRLREMEEEALLAMKDRRREAALQALERLWDGFAKAELPADEAKRIVLEILVQLFRLVKDAGANHARLFDYKLGDYEYVMRARTLDDLFAFTEKRCSAVLELLQRTNEIRPKKVYDEVREIVREQYASPISLKSVAQQIYMNPNYLGKLFKAHADMSFNEYVLKVRMEKAKELLLHTDKKVYEIALEVGFGELDWFYKRFKAYTGVSASEFKLSSQQST